MRASLHPHLEQGKRDLEPEKECGPPRKLRSLLWVCREMGWDIDCVVPVPDGSRPAAIQISAELGLPYREGLVKNRYVGRTFIMPDQQCAPPGPPTLNLHTGLP